MALPSILLLFSYVNGSPGGRTGSVGDGGHTCTDCHSGTAQPKVGWITSNIPVEGYTPGTTYTITATGTFSGVNKFGFELTAEDPFGSKIGTFSITDPSRTKLANANSSVTHTSSGTSVSGNSSTWSMNWTAPSSPSPSVIKFYAAFNAANGNGSTSGDVIFTSSVSYTLFVPPVPEITSVEPDHEQQNYEGELNIIGSATNWTQGVSNVSFRYHDDNTILFDATDIAVVNDEMITVTVSIPGDIEIGTYDVVVDDLTLQNGFVVDIYDDILTLSDASIKVYPNPATDVLSVNAPINSQITLMEMSGKVIASQISENEISKIDVSLLNDGIYLMQVSQNGVSIVKKIIKN